MTALALAAVGDEIAPPEVHRRVAATELRGNELFHQVQDGRGGAHDDAAVRGGRGDGPVGSAAEVHRQRVAGWCGDHPHVAQADDWLRAGAEEREELRESDLVGGDGRGTAVAQQRLRPHPLLLVGSDTAPPAGAVGRHLLLAELLVGQQADGRGGALRQLLADVEEEELRVPPPDLGVHRGGLLRLQVVGEAHHAPPRRAVPPVGDIQGGVEAEEAQDMRGVAGGKGAERREMGCGRVGR